jgi:SAM-dependent methyltransferase
MTRKEQQPRAAAGELGASWTRYWAGGHNASFGANGDDFDSAPFWLDFFSTLADGAGVLDLATGGGHVVRLALAAAAKAERAYEIHGVDLADIRALRRAFGASGRSTLRLTGRCDLAKLPFDDAAFDAVTSQFGIEYADRSAAAREAVRVLKPAGRGLFLLHHAESAIAMAAAERLRAHRAVMPDDSAFRHGERVFSILSSGAPRLAAMTEVTKFQSAVQAALGRLSPDARLANTAEIVYFLADVARAPDRYDPRDALRRLLAAEEEVRHWMLRQQALIDAALDAQGIHALAQALEVAGAQVRAPEPFRDASGTLLAWVLGFRRAA